MRDHHCRFATLFLKDNGVRRGAVEEVFVAGFCAGAEAVGCGAGDLAGAGEAAERVVAVGGDNGSAGVGFAGRLAGRKLTRPFGFFEKFGVKRGGSLKLLLAAEVWIKALLLTS